MPKYTRPTLLRIEAIADRMRNLTFKRGETVKEFAAEWHLSIDRVKRLSAEASRIVMAEVTDPERVKPDLCALLADAARSAHAERDFNGLAQLARVYADILGFRAATTTNIKIEPGERSPADARRIVAEIFGATALPPAAPKTEKPS